MRHDSIKLATEETVAKAFVDHLAALGIPTVSRRPGDPGEPDIVCTGVDGREFGIEITAGYHGPQDARQLRTIVADLARSGKRQTVMSTSGMEDADLPPGLIRNPDLKLATNLQKAMESKRPKRFGIRTYLILDGSWAPITKTEDAPAILAQLKRPDPFPYVDVLLCLTQNWTGGREFFRVP